MNKLLKDAEISGRGTPASDTDSRGRKGKKGKGRMNAPDFDSVGPTAGKRKRAVKSTSVTPSINDDDDDDDREQVGS